MSAGFYTTKIRYSTAIILIFITKNLASELRASGNFLGIAIIHNKLFLGDIQVNANCFVHSYPYISTKQSLKFGAFAPICIEKLSISFMYAL